MKSSENLDIVDVVLVSLLLTLNILHTFFLVFLLLALNRCMFAGKHSLQIEKIYKFNSSVEVQLPSMDYSDRFHSSFLNFWVTNFWKLTPWSILKFLPSDVSLISVNLPYSHSWIPVIDVIRMSLPTASYLAQINSAILCLEDDFLLSNI